MRRRPEGGGAAAAIKACGHVPGPLTCAAHTQTQTRTAPPPPPARAPQRRTRAQATAHFAPFSLAPPDAAWEKLRLAARHFGRPSLPRRGLALVVGQGTAGPGGRGAAPRLTGPLDSLVVAVGPRARGARTAGLGLRWRLLGRGRPQWQWGRQGPSSRIEPSPAVRAAGPPRAAAVLGPLLSRRLAPPHGAAPPPPRRRPRRCAAGKASLRDVKARWKSCPSRPLSATQVARK
jgi:hypothetical protein